MKFNASMIQNFMKCPLQAKFKYIDGFSEPQNSAASYGTALHDALETYALTGDIELTLERFTDIWDHPDKLGIKPDIWIKGSSFGGYRQMGLDALKAYHESQVWEKREIIATEYAFCVPMGEHEISGVVDMMEIKKTNKGPVLQIVDFKSGKVPYKNELMLNIQFTVYVWASLQKEFWTGVKNSPKYTGYGPENGAKLFEEYKDYIRQPIWFNIAQAKNIDVGRRDEQDFLRLYRCINEIAKAVENDIFIPNISGATCNFCPFQEQCGVVIPVIDKFGQEEQDLI